MAIMGQSITVWDYRLKSIIQFNEIMCKYFVNFYMCGWYYHGIIM